MPSTNTCECCTALPGSNWQFLKELAFYTEAQILKRLLPFPLDASSWASKRLVESWMTLR